MKPRNSSRGRQFRKLLCTLFILTLPQLVLTQTAHAELQLPKLFSDNMVVQRNTEIPVWGTANPAQTITVKLAKHSASTLVDATGNWQLALPALKEGGDYQLHISAGDETITFNHVTAGDVWLCSGQSNMEWPLAKANNSAQEIAAANYPNVRMFTVEKQFSITPKNDVKSGTWQPATPEVAGGFSAVCYFFGRKIHQELNIPIGLIHSSWGGTDIQPWTSWKAMQKLDKYKDLTPAVMAEKFKDNDKRIAKYKEALKTDRGLTEKWYLEAHSSDLWEPVDVPSYWKHTPIGNADGIAWFRTEFNVPKALVGKPATISLGPIDDEDHTYINGKLVGSQDNWQEERSYSIDKNSLTAGKNSLVIKVFDNIGGGGIYGDANSLFVEIDGQQIPLNNTWQYRPSVLSSQFNITATGPNAFPSILYNAMIHPLIKTPITGVTWYQGENNAWEAYRYRSLFKTMILDWRKQWNIEFPFYWVQLANFMTPSEQPSESAWAELREAQDMALSLPKTGQALAIDIGEANDIHPRNKQDVGHRLALNALHHHYGEKIAFSGPRYREMATNGDKITLSFNHAHGGLNAKSNKNGTVKGFAISGSDKHFVWAKAEIQGDKIVVWSDEITKPVAVRYAWGDNPNDANLINSEGLPAVPFRTDDWQGTTQSNQIYNEY